MHYLMPSIFWYATEDADEKSHGKRESAEPFSLDDSPGMNIYPAAVRFIPSITPWRCVVRESIIAQRNYPRACGYAVPQFRSAPTAPFSERP